MKQQANYNTSRILLSNSEQWYIVAIDQLVYCQAHSNYTKIYLSNGTCFVASRHLKSFEAQLTPHDFHRPHQSFLVNLSHVVRLNKYKASLLLSQGSLIPLSQKRKTDFQQKLKAFCQIS